MPAYGLDDARTDWIAAARPDGRSMTLAERVADLYAQHRDEVYRYAATLGVSPPEAQEFTQEAFLRLFQVMAAGKPIRQHRAWVFAVARNLALNRKERASRESGAAVEGFQSAGDPESELIAKERMRMVHAAVETLSPQQRQCLFLRVQGFRYREIAEITGVSTSSVGEFLRRALNRLRKATQ
jgi:RNA polymerase sigma-70 factor (ECF subfamily)